MIDSYSCDSSLILGFHGCEKELAKDIILGQKKMEKSRNEYDWLGSGIYFWENDFERALEFATEIKKCEEPFVVGAILSLNYCLNLTRREDIKILKNTYELIVGKTIHKVNKAGKGAGINGDLKLRFLDCETLEALHKFNRDYNVRSYDSVKAAFWEGEELYATAGFREKNHIQICIRNPEECILGYFLPPGFKLDK